jgi:hypothetical protein
MDDVHGFTRSLTRIWGARFSQKFFSYYFQLFNGNQRDGLKNYFATRAPNPSLPACIGQQQPTMRASHERQFYL